MNQYHEDQKVHIEAGDKYRKAERELKNHVGGLPDAYTRGKLESYEEHANRVGEYIEEKIAEGTVEPQDVDVARENVEIMKEQGRMMDNAIEK